MTDPTTTRAPQVTDRPTYPDTTALAETILRRFAGRSVQAWPGHLVSVHPEVPHEALLPTVGAEFAGSGLAVEHVLCAQGDGGPSVRFRLVEAPGA